MTEQSEEQQLIAQKFDQLKEFVLGKNRQYGSSALHPTHIFSRAPAKESIFIRLDDKLSRVIKGNFSIETMEDTLRDIVGYCVLALITLEQEKKE